MHIVLKDNAKETELMRNTEQNELKEEDMKVLFKIIDLTVITNNIIYELETTPKAFK